MIDIANTDDLQSEPGNVERLVFHIDLGAKICGMVVLRVFKYKIITVRANSLHLIWTKLS